MQLRCAVAGTSFTSRNVEETIQLHAAPISIAFLLLTIHSSDGMFMCIAIGVCTQACKYGAIITFAVHLDECQIDPIIIARLCAIYARLRAGVLRAATYVLGKQF